LGTPAINSILIVRTFWLELASPPSRAALIGRIISAVPELTPQIARPIDLRAPSNRRRRERGPKARDRDASAIIWIFRNPLKVSDLNLIPVVEFVSLTSLEVAV